MARLRHLLPLIVVIAAHPAAALAAQPAQNGGGSPWTPVGALPATSGGAQREVSASRYQAYAIDEKAVRTQVADAPPEDARRNLAVVTIGAPDGTLQRFRVVNSPVMA